MDILTIKPEIIPDISNAVKEISCRIPHETGFYIEEIEVEEGLLIIELSVVYDIYQDSTFEDWPCSIELYHFNYDIVLLSERGVPLMYTPGKDNLDKIIYDNLI